MIELLFQKAFLKKIKFNDFPGFTVFDIMVSKESLSMDAVATLMSF